MLREQTDQIAAQGARLLAACVLLLGIAGTLQMATAQEVTLNERLAKLGLPAIETLTAESDYTVFMQPNVPDDIRVLALRKLWSQPMSNRVDDLNTYAEAYGPAESMPAQTTKAATAALNEQSAR